MDKSKAKGPQDGKIREDQVKEGQVEESQIQGEGDYAASRRYRDEVRQFIGAHGKDIPKMAEDAEKAVENDKSGELSRAEAAGKAKARG